MACPTEKAIMASIGCWFATPLIPSVPNRVPMLVPPLIEFLIV